MPPHNIASKSRWSGLTLRQSLFLGAGLGILLPALLLAYFQIVGKLEAEVEVRVREPMHQYTEVLSRGLAAAIWNVDKGYALELMDAVMRNPDVVSVTATDDFREIFAKQEKAVATGGVLLQAERDISYNGRRVGHLLVVMSTARVQNEMIANLFKLALALAAQVAISFMFIWLMFERRMMRPLKILQDGALRLAQGALDQPLQWTRQDEMGGLAQGLDTMRAKLAALIAEREQKNDALQIELEERKRMEAALVVSQAKFAGIFDASPIAMTVSRMGGDYAVFDVNTAWTRTFAVDRAAALRYKHDQPGIWKTLDDREIVLERLLVNGEVSRAPAWMRRGQDLPDMLCEISGRVLELGGEPLLILAYEDVTQRHQYEVDILQLNTTLEHRVAKRTQELTRALDQLTAAKDELVRSEKLSALGALVAGIAHELNTPIGNSLTVASTLQDHSNRFRSELSKGISRSRLEEYVASTTHGAEILMRALHHAAELVASFKQVAVDQTSVNRRQFKLGATVAEILTTLGPTLRKTTHTVQCTIPQDITLDSYPGPLGQIVTNLINNAVLHAFEGREHGVISIAAELLPESRVRLTVQDNGRGIPPENLAKVFDPFFTTKFGKGGSGLGLNIVYNLATTSLGGSIRVDSAPGQGACFTLELPLTAKSNPIAVDGA
jgi:signal transduction histidine kinase